MSRFAVILALVVLMAGGLAACGKKGPLEAPPDNAAVVVDEAWPA